MTPKYRDGEAAALFEELARLVRSRMEADRASIRAVSRQGGMSFNTVRRLLRGQAIDLEAFAALARWTGHSLLLERREPDPPPDEEFDVAVAPC